LTTPTSHAHRTPPAPASTAFDSLPIPCCVVCRPCQLFVDPCAPARGYGVRASVAIPKRSLVCEYAGELLEAAEAEAREAEYSQRLVPPGCYMMYLSWRGKDWCFDATDVNEGEAEGRQTLKCGFGRYINHSQDRPNLRPRLMELPLEDASHQPWPVRPRVALIALRHIRPKEELLFDYRDRRRDIHSQHPLDEAVERGRRERATEALESLF
jgi:SET domain-containing protein